MFLIFGGENYYPGGGVADLMGTVETTLADAARVAEGMIAEDGYNPDWVHIFDTETKKVHALGSRKISSKQTRWSEWGGNPTVIVGSPIPTVTLTDGQSEFLASGGPIGKMTGIIPKD